LIDTLIYDALFAPYIYRCILHLKLRCILSDEINHAEFCQVRDLEAELDLEQRRGRDAAAENKKLQKQLTDLRAQADDDHRTVAELSDQNTTLQMRLVTMKRQLDENVSSRHCCLGLLTYCL